VNLLNYFLRNFNRYLLFLYFFIANNYFLSAQHTNILINNLNFPNEPSIAINPLNTNSLVAGSNLNKVFYSNNEGYSWQYNSLTSEYGVWGDPCVIAGKNNTFFYFHLSNPDDGNWIDRIVCQKSTDGGINWNSGTYIGLNGTKAQDKEWAVYDRQNDIIYVTWTQFDEYGSVRPEDQSLILFSKSIDGGNSWATPIVISDEAGDCIDDDNTVEGAVPAIGPNGEIFVSWAGHEKIYFDKSVDGGETWLNQDKIIANMPGGWVFDIPGINRCNGMPITTCDTSRGIYRGNIYVNWADQRNGENNTDIFITKSVDGGETWSNAKRVNDDITENHQFFSWMTIDQATGYIYIVFYDRRNYDNNYTDVFMALSKDGGESFTNFKISEEPYYPYSSVFLGDYINITAYNNIIRPIWVSYENDELNLWTADINIDSLETSSNLSVPFVVEQNYPNPFSELTIFTFRLKRKSKINLYIYSTFGEKLATIIDNEEKNIGKYVYTLQANILNLKPGVYFLELTSNSQKIIKKMIYIK